jgi:hypothetical protein
MFTFLGEEDILATVRTISFASGSKFLVVGNVLLATVEIKKTGALMENSASRPMR